jgi:hypothetical protein
MEAFERSDRTCHCRNVYTRLCSGCVGVSLVYHAVLAMSASIIYCYGAAHEYKPQFNVTARYVLYIEGNYTKVQQGLPHVRYLCGWPTAFRTNDVTCCSFLRVDVLLSLYSLSNTA